MRVAPSKNPVKSSLQVAEAGMKSLSRIHSLTSGQQLATWAPAELEVEFVVASDEIQSEHILRILRRAEEEAIQEKEGLTVLLPQIANRSVIAWQPEEIDLQPPLPEITTWDFVEPLHEVEETPPQEFLGEEQEPNPEKEAEEILTKARLHAEEIILEARATADKIVLQAQDEIDLEKKEGYQQGWNEGRSELGKALSAVRAAAEEVREWRDALTTQGEQILVEMLKDIAQTIFGEGVRLDANALQINLNRVMEHAQKLGDLNIFLNTRDAEMLDPSWSEYQLLITGNRVKVIPSEKITPGGCIVKGSMGMVDGRVETQLAAVINTIEEISEAKE
jgi:flagellar assembly protein FliH